MHAHLLLRVKQRNKMSNTSTPPKCFKFIRLLKPLNPKSQSSFLHLVTEKSSFNNAKNQPPIEPSSYLSSSPPSSSPIITEIVDFLKSNDNESWKSNKQLSHLLSSLSSDHFLQITRHLETSSAALNFVEHLRSNSHCPDGKSLSFVFQAAIELASRESGKGDRLLELYKKSKELSVPLTVNSATQLIRCLSRGKMIDEAMMIYDNLDAQMKNVHVRNVVIGGLLSNQRLGDALLVLDEMLQPNAEFPPDENTGNIVFQAVSLSKKYANGMGEEELVKLVSRFGSHGVFPDSVRLTKWITTLCNKRKSDKAWELLHTVMELDGTVKVAPFNALLTGLKVMRQYNKMNLLMKEMQEKGICPNVVTLGIGISHLCTSLRIEEALDLFEKMKRGEVGNAIELDVVIYNTLISGLCKVGRVEEGLAMMRRMIPEDKCSPNASTYNCLINGFFKAGELDKSLELFDEMNRKGVEPNVITVNTLVDGLCRHGRAGSALKFYREMQEKGLNGNAVTYTTLMSGFCGVNNIRKAMKLLAEMKERCTPDAIVYYTLISGLSQAGLMDEVESVLSDMKTAGFSPDLPCYNVMINGFCKKNRLRNIRDLLKDMEGNGIRPDSVTYNTLISHFSRVGDLKMSLRLLRQMVDDKIYPTIVTYGTLIHACCSVGDLDEAMKIFREMNSSTRGSPNTVIYNTLIDSLCQKKRVKVALTLFKDMIDAQVRPNTNTFNALFKGLREENCLDKALELMDKMTILSCTPDYITLEVLTEWLCAVGEADKLRQFVEGHTDAASSPEQQSVHTTI